LKKLQVTNFDFCQAILRPHQSDAHDTSNACHTLDTPLLFPFTYACKEKAGNLKNALKVKHVCFYYYHVADWLWIMYNAEAEALKSLEFFKTIEDYSNLFV